MTIINTKLTLQVDQIKLVNCMIFHQCRENIPCPRTNHIVKKGKQKDNNVRIYSSKCFFFEPVLSLINYMPNYSAVSYCSGIITYNIFTSMKSEGNLVSTKISTIKPAFRRSFQEHSFILSVKYRSATILNVHFL